MRSGVREWADLAGLGRGTGLLKCLDNFTLPGAASQPRDRFRNSLWQREDMRPFINRRMGGDSQ